MLSDSSQKSSNQQQLRASVPVTSSTSKPNLRIFPSISSPSGTRFPPLSRPLQTRPSSGGVSGSGRQSMSLSTPSPQPTQEDQNEAKTLSRPWKQPTKPQSISVAEGQALGQDSSLDITRLLQSLRHDVNSLQCSGYGQILFKACCQALARTENHHKLTLSPVLRVTTKITLRSPFSTGNWSGSRMPLSLLLHQHYHRQRTAIRAAPTAPPPPRNVTRSFAAGTLAAGAANSQIRAISYGISGNDRVKWESFVAPFAVPTSPAVRHVMRTKRSEPVGRRRAIIHTNPIDDCENRRMCFPVFLSELERCPTFVIIFV